MKSALIRRFLVSSALFLSLVLGGCTFDSPSDSVQLTFKPTTPSPSDNSTNQSRSLQLSWESVNSSSYDVYLDTQNPPTALAASNITAKNFTANSLIANTKYYWRVVAKNSTGTSAGDVWSFTTGTTINPTQSGEILVLNKISTQKPCSVNMIFQVVDFSGKGVAGLTGADFDLNEDGLPVSLSESNIAITPKADVFDTLKVVLMLDNSTSLAPNIEQIRLAASNLAFNLVNTTIDGRKLHVFLSIYQFSEKVEKMCDFMTDGDRLFGVVFDNYALGKASTDLYGATMTGTKQWSDVMTTDKIRQGLLILFTDGSDTQGSHSLGDAMAAVYNKKVITIGLGNDIDPEILSRLGTAGYFQINDINEMNAKFQDVQRSILDYVNSFYVMKYQSPKRGNFDHLLRLMIKNNQNTGVASYIEGYYNSYGFYSN